MARNTTNVREWERATGQSEELGCHTGGLDPASAESRATHAALDPIRLTLGEVCLIMSVVAYALSATVVDPDLWGHVKFGQDIWQSGKVIQHDAYSYLTGDQPWINHEWLAEMIFAALFALGGAPVLILFKTGMVLVTLGLIYWHLTRQGMSALRGGIVLTLMAPIFAVGTFVLRPQIFTYLLFLATLLVLNAAERGRSRWLCGLPPIYASWVNLQGGFLAGMATVIVWTSVRFLASFRRAVRTDWSALHPEWPFVGSVVAGGLATLVNPYGPRMLDFLVKPATLVRPDISEWQPTVLASANGAVYLIPFALAVVGLLYTTRERRPAPLVLFLCVAILPLLAFRHGPLLAIGVPILAGEHIGSAWDRWSPRLRVGRRTLQQIRAERWLAVLAMTGAAAFVWLSLPNFRCIRTLRPVSQGFPAKAVAMLRDSGVSGNMAVFFDWGEYAIWHLSPRIRVSVDGRRETVYSDKILAENWRFLTGVGAWDTLIGRQETDLALVPKDRPVFNLLKLSPGWVLVHEDSLGGLFARDGSAHIERIQAANAGRVPDDGNGMCFP